MSKKHNHHNCLDCGVNTASIGEHYFLKNDVWFKAHHSERGMLCIGCVEKRLGRLLTSADFTDCHVNRPQAGKVFSQRLLSRLTSR
jgi:hypothetical protein